MAVLIASSVGTAAAACSGRGYQRHLVYAANSGVWLAFFFSSTAGLSCYYSSDFITWSAATGSPYTLPQTHDSEGRNLSVECANISSTDVLHIVFCTLATGSGNMHVNDIRATFVGTTFSVSTASSIVSTSGYTPTQPAACSSLVDSTGRPIVLGGSFGFIGGGDPGVFRATNTDAGSSWTAGWGTGTDLWSSGVDYGHGGTLLDLGSGNVLALFDDASAAGASDMKQVKWSKWNGSSWSAAANVFSSSLAAGVNAGDFGAVDRSTSAIDCVMRASSSNTNTYTHRIFNGSSWSAGASIPNQTYKASTGNFTLATDGTNTYLSVLNTDTPNTIQYIKYDGSSWDAAWSATENTGSQTRNYLSCWPTVVSSSIGFLYTQTNGSNFDLYGSLLSLSTPSVMLWYPRVWYPANNPIYAE